MSSLSQLYFLNRLRSLQWLCSNTDSTCPKALLIIPGPDGRHNASSIQVLKYLFLGSVGKALLDDVLDDGWEVLDDIVLLIKENIVHVLWSEEMKQQVLPLISAIPRLAEYSYSRAEELDVDKFQLRKCIHFKRMILNALQPQDSVGIAVPVAYDDIMEVEGWPMLQAFALDNVFTSTGFFTANYNIVDMTASFENLFRSVDSYCVDNALGLLSSAVIPHMQQLLTAMDAPTASQRARISADEAIGPIDVLYEFGELDALATPEKMCRPYLLFGRSTSFVGNMTSPKISNWREETMNDSLHAVLEGSEPITGLRWCRTYFLKHGTEVRLAEKVKATSNALNGISAVQRNLKSNKDDDSENDSDNEEEIQPDVSSSLRRPSAESVATVERLHKLYFKLWQNLRTVVHDVFLKYHDVLDAGTEIQNRLIEVFNNNQSSNDRAAESKFEQFIDSVELFPHEKLQIHMDCMNGAGEIITVDDVDDLGGSCWMYIRASVHNISLSSSQGESGAVAVGDTFLFSTLSNRHVQTPGSDLRSAFLSHEVIVHAADYTCITGAIPYVQSFVGIGVEEDYTRLVQYCAKHAATLPTLSVGRSVTADATAVVHTLCDSSLLPFCTAEILMFSSGFIVQKVNSQQCVPLVISFAENVQRVQSIDLRDCFRQMQLGGNSVLSNDMRDQVLSELPEGYVLLFELKKNAQGLDPLDTFFACLSQRESHYLALVVLQSGQSAAIGSNSSFSVNRTMGISSSIIDHWRSSMRLHDIEECKGKSNSSLPKKILRSLFVLFDGFLRVAVARSPTSADETASSSDPDIKHVIQVAQHYQELSSFPGVGVAAMRAMHALSDSQRISSFDFSSLLFVDEPEPPTAVSNDVVVVVVAGVAGSGIDVVSSQLAQQLTAAGGNNSSGHANRFDSVDLVRLDFSQFMDVSLDSKASQAKIFSYVTGKLQYALRSQRKGHRKLILLQSTVSVSAGQDFHSLLTMLGALSEVRIGSVIAVTSVNQLCAVKREQPPSREEDNCLGKEDVTALMRELLHVSCCDSIVTIDLPGSAHYSALRSMLSRLNPSANLIRLSPLNIALLEEDVELLVERFSNNSAVDSVRESASIAMGFPAYSLLCKLGKSAVSLQPSIDATRVTAPSIATVREVKLTPQSLGISQWAFESIVSLLYELFPNARTNSLAVQSFWSTGRAAPKTNTMRRLLQLASAKVLHDRHRKEIAARFQKGFTSILSTDTNLLSALRTGMIGIHGTLFLENESVGHASQAAAVATRGSKASCVTVEANSAFISLRDKALANGSETASPSESFLIVSGFFSTNVLKIMKELFAVCEKFGLERLSPLDFAVVRSCAAEAKRIQSLGRFQSRPLPSGWWFDGYFFVDHSGMHVELRPDIDDIIHEYVNEENAKIHHYNFTVDEVETRQ